MVKIYRNIRTKELLIRSSVRNFVTFVSAINNHQVQRGMEVAKIIQKYVYSIGTQPIAHVSFACVSKT